ncbi:hypothetical protein [Nonomuraea sp. NEAU-A123]|uniref:hypothetical protein n=1 Tax=Nonomuraea sp. NEAU-A123 TaxID=2839649 RepID=UPI001BE4BE65|nr:hypothetical protein [Nonomuraea sp. NEAU-A123]MBT2226286.1 hypothetical protein [Nonomuraea sp. NEAU-A123]
MINFLRRPREDSVRAAQLAAEAAEAKQREIRALVDTERANADLAAVRERADATARERELRAAIRLAPLEAEAERIAAAQAEDERTRTIAARAANDAAEAEQSRTAAARREVAVRALIRRRLVAVAFAGVSLVAFGGQSVSYAIGAQWWPIAAVAVSLVVEAIGLALGWLAHEATLDDEPAGGLQASAYGVALYVAMLNYWHWSKDWTPTPEAALFTGCSAIAPWLLHAYTRKTYAAKRRAEGRPLPRAPHFMKTRWILWFPSTFGTVRLAIRTGESDPNVAALAYEQRQEDKARARELAAADPDRAELERALDAARSDLAAVAEAYVSALDANDTAQAERAELERSHAAALKALEAKERDRVDEQDDEPAGVHVLPEVPSLDEQESMSKAELQEAARRTIRAARLANIPITGKTIGEAYDRGDRWGQLRMAEVPPFVVAGKVDDEAAEAPAGEESGNGKRPEGQ